MRTANAGLLSRSILTALLAFSLSCARELRLSESPWLELESEHFLLRTDLEEEDARATIQDLERVRAAFLKALSWGGEPVPVSRPFLVIEMQDLAELNEFSRQGMEGFVSVYGLGERLVAMSAEQSPSSQPTLKHELAHAVASQMLRRQPAWFAEGLACFLETTQLQDWEGRDLIGEIDEQRVQWLAQHGAMPAAQVFAAQNASQLQLNDSYRFESSAYQIFFMLFNQRPGPLASFMRRLAHGDEPKAAFAKVFPDLTPERIDQLVLESQERGAHYTKLAVPLTPYRGRIRVRALPMSEVHAQLAVLFSLSPGVVEPAQRARAAQRAKTEAKAALALDPGSPEALSVLFELGENSGDARADRDERIRLSRKATALHPQSWRAQLLLANALTENPQLALLSPEEHRAAATERLVAARAASELEPHEPALLSLYANALAGQGFIEEAVPIAERAVTLDPSSPTALSVLAELLGAEAQCEDSSRLLERAVELVPENAQRGFAEAMRSLQSRVSASCASNLEAQTMMRKLAPVAAARDRGINSAESLHDARAPIDRLPSLISCARRGPSIPVPASRASSSGSSGKLSAEVRYVVGDDGRVKKVEGLSGSASLVAAIRSWLQGCTYEPGRRGGQPIDAQVQEVFSFALR